MFELAFKRTLLIVRSSLYKYTTKVVVSRISDDQGDISGARQRDVPSHHDQGNIDIHNLSLRTQYK